MSDITADSSLFKSVMLQSIDFIISVAFIDKEFGIKIPVEFQDYDQMDTIAQITAIIIQQANN